MPPVGYQLRPRHVCSMALMTLAAFAALSQHSSAAAGTGPVAEDALTGPQPVRSDLPDPAATQPSGLQAVQAYRAKARPYALQHVRRHIYPVDAAQVVVRPPAPAPAPSPSPSQEAPAAAPAEASGSPQQYAESLVGSAEFACLDELWTRESGWNVYAENPSSGAYGIPQALPGDKMASAGSDWQTDADVQVRWGISYIDETYGSPCGAEQHENEFGWY